MGYDTGAMYLTGYLDEMVVFKDILSDADADAIRNNTYGSYARKTATVLAINYATTSTGTIQLLQTAGSDIVDDDILYDGTDSITINGTLTELTEFYVLGELHITSGNNDGQRRPILSVASNVFTVIWPFPYAVAASDTFDIYPGCDKRGIVCKNTFNNKENFSGFLYIPFVESVMGGI
jgi:hypothetical protein